MKILVTGEGPWTALNGGRPGYFIGSHISEVRPLCIAEALQQAGCDVSFMSSKGASDKGGFSFKCVGVNANPDDFDIVVCHQSMFWLYKGFEKWKKHPNILLSGDLFPKGDTVIPNVKWVFYDAPNHKEIPRMINIFPQALIQEGCFGVTAYDVLPNPFFNNQKPNVVYLGKIYSREQCNFLNQLVESNDFNVWFGGKMAGWLVNRTYDCALTDKEKAEFFNKNLNFITHKTDGSGPVEIMEAAQYCQYADVGLVFDPHVRTATVSKIYFYMSCGLPILVYGGCSNENHVLEAQAGILAPENSSITESIHLILKDRNTYKQSIKEKVFDKWGYDQIVLKWLSAIKGCIDKNLEQELQYWKWEAKKLSNLNSELSGRDAFDKPFDSFVESLIESPVGSHVKILDVGCGPISPLGLISNKYKIEVVGIDPLAKEYNDLLDERSIGAGSPLRPRYGSAENLREIFPDGTFDIAVAFNSLDHSFDPVAGINQTIQVLKPNGLLYVWCYQNEGKYENYRGLHQWNLDIQEGHLVLGKQGTNYKRIADSLEGGVITVQWFTMDGKPKVHFIIRRAA